MHDGHPRLLTIDVALNTAAPSAMSAGHSLPSYSDLNCARDRVRAAIYNSGAHWPDGHLTLTSSHADIGSGTADLAIAVAVLAVDAVVSVPAGTVFIGQLTLDGRLRPTEQTPQAVLAAHAAGYTRAVVPTGSLRDAATLPESITVLEADTLPAVTAWLTRHSHRFDRYRVPSPGMHTPSPSLAHPAARPSTGAIPVRKALHVPRYTNKDLAVRLMSVLTDGMEHGTIDWNCRSINEIIATSGDPTDAMNAVIQKREIDSGQQRDQFMPQVFAIVDRIRASRLTFGPDDNPTYYIGTMLDGYIAADAPLIHCDDPIMSQDEIELSITEPAQCGTVILSGSEVDALIAGLTRWRAAHPDRRTAPENGSRSG